MSDCKIEPAKTGRSKCRKCRDKIEKDSLRMGIISYQFDSDGSWSWYHLNCGAGLNPEGFDAAVEEFDGEIEGIEEMRAEARKAARKNLMPRVEAAPSGRAACVACSEKIAPKGTLRVVMAREEEEGVPPRAAYVHVGCAAKHVEFEGDLKKTLLENSDLDAEQLTSFGSEF
jgi:hypothetical protein